MENFEDLQEPLLTAPKYYWGCCQVCKRAGTKEEPLKKCSRCNCLFYCCKEHQKANWKDHKKLCSYLATAAEEVGADIFFGQQIEFNDDEDDDDEKENGEKPNEKILSWKSWTKFRVKAAKMAEILLGKPLDPHEKEISAINLSLSDLEFCGKGHDSALHVLSSYTVAYGISTSSSSLRTVTLTFMAPKSHHESTKQ
mgnify:CR=1 FL=1